MKKSIKAQRIITRNKYEIGKYQTFKEMALAREDNEFAIQCQAKIDKLSKGIEKWRLVL